MINFIKSIISSLSSLEIKFYCLLVFLTTIASIGIVYWQYNSLYKETAIRIESNLISSKKALDESFNAYHSILKLISVKISEQEGKTHPEFISALLKQFYIAPRNQEDSKVNFIDINWQEINGNTLNRYGNLPTTDLPQNIEHHVKTFPNQAYLFNLIDENKSSSVTNMFLTMGVLDSNKHYIGKLTLQLDFDAWLTNLKSKANTTGLIILLADQNNELLLTTDQNINFSPSLIPLNKADKQYSQLSQVVDEGSFTLTHYLTLQPYDYVLFYGYNKQYIYEYTIKRFIPLLLILWGALLIFITSQLFFSKQLKKRINQNYYNDIKKLTLQNIKSANEKELIKNKFSKQIKIYKSDISNYSNKLHVIKISENEKKKLEQFISKRTLSSLIELQETARVLLESLEGKLNIAVSYEQQLRLLAGMYNKLEFIASGCIVKEKDEIIDVHTLIDDTLRIFAKDIIDSKISVKINVTKVIKDFYFDELLLRQILANLIRESISCAKPTGEVKITAITKKSTINETLIIIISDDGFGVSEQYSITPNKESSGQLSILPLELELRDIKELIESNGGQLNIEYVIGTGKTITCCLPYKDAKSNLTLGENVVHFKKT